MPCFRKTPLVLQHVSREACAIDPSSSFKRSGFILVVDDEPDICFPAFDLFGHLGFEGVLAADGVTALECMKEPRGSSA